MNHEEHDKLWELLGKTGERKASPFFVNKVMHAIRRQDTYRREEPFTIWMWLRQRWFIPAAAGVCAVFAAFNLLQGPTTSPSPKALSSADPLAEMVAVISETDEFDTSLTDLIATEDNSVWLAADPSSLF
jgi:hypothetical protein